MNLRDQLKEILPDILPRNPNKSIKGTELIESVKYLLKQEYSDATLRYHFSIMSCDPSSPIAKVAQGQGYYLRTETIHSLNSARNMLSSGGGEHLQFNNEDSDLSITRANKFRAVVQRYYESVAQTPFSFEESFSENAMANRWKVPDMAIVEWKSGHASEDGVVLDRNQTEVLRKLGMTPIEISGVKLRLELNHHNISEDLHQCLATSEWANGGQIVVAAPIDDPALLETVLNFASRYGIGVTSFGLDADMIDDLPEPAAIENLMPREFEAIQSLFRVTHHALPQSRGQFDWQHVNKSSAINGDFGRFERWISSCLVEERVISPREFLHLERSAVSTVSAVA
ncbi:MAG: hypothetical protein P1U89_18075 [Verrucomicrobiales bacterium]|nr:hypothetical protein [Verrucomicrobiales bacterium]